jgi:hypothetical protein
MSELKRFATFPLSFRFLSRGKLVVEQSPATSLRIHTGDLPSCPLSPQHPLSSMAKAIFWDDLPQLSRSRSSMAKRLLSSGVRRSTSVALSSATRLVALSCYAPRNGINTAVVEIPQLPPQTPYCQSPQVWPLPSPCTFKDPLQGRSRDDSSQNRTRSRCHRAIEALRGCSPTIRSQEANGCP